MKDVLVSNQAQKAMEEIKKIMVGKDRVIKQMMTAILAGGHILIEDIPGVGKTTLALAFSKVLGLQYKRIQFTPDVMPSDIVGFSVYQPDTGKFQYQEGAAMTNLLLADEINRTSPKTQSALLEAMEEGKITTDGKTRTLPDPYVVIATQNPMGSIGTQSLPESQLDRFMICTSVGYPDQESEVAMLKQQQVNLSVEQIEEQVTIEGLRLMRKEVNLTYVHDDILNYIVSLANATRKSRYLSFGISPRGTIAILQMAKANAYLCSREYVVPSDLREILYVTAGHRILLSKEAKIQKKTAEEILKEIFEALPLPKGNR